MTAHEQYREDLPLYAVGALTGDEAERLKRHLAECPACSDELRSLNEAAAQIAMAVEQAAPPARLREHLLARLEEQRSGPFTRLGDQAAVRGLRARSAWFWVPVFAAVVLALALLTLWRQERGLLQENQVLTAKLETNDRVLHRARALVDTLTAPDAQRVTLVAAGAKPQPEAKTVYSSRQRGLVLLADNLNPLPVRKTYELWLLPANGAQPIPAGTFKPDARGSATLVLSPFADGIAAKGFAVTIENEPGSATPTMPIVLSGTT